jgi:hypothetical protein
MRTSDCVQNKLNSPLERSTSHRRPLLLNHSVKVSLRIDLIVVRCLRLAGLVDVSLPSLSNRFSRATFIFGRIDSILDCLFRNASPIHPIHSTHVIRHTCASTKNKNVTVYGPWYAQGIIPSL